MTAKTRSDIDDFIDAIDPKTMRDGKSLRAIAEALQLSQEADARLREAVGAARSAGDSWTMIGLMLGTSKQNAYRKYGKVELRN